MKLIVSPSPDTFLGSLDAFHVYWHFWKHQLVSYNQGQSNFVTQNRRSRPPPMEGWRGPGLPVSWDTRRKAPGMMTGSGRRVAPNCRGLESQLGGGNTIHDDVQMSLYIKGTLWAEPKSRDFVLSHLLYVTKGLIFFGFLVGQTNEIQAFYLLCKFSEFKLDVPWLVW